MYLDDNFLYLFYFRTIIHKLHLVKYIIELAVCKLLNMAMYSCRIW